MERDPSIHIRQSKLLKILKESMEYFQDEPYDSSLHVRKIMQLAKTHSTCSRSIFISNDKVDKKVKKLTTIGRSDTAIFAQMLLLIRRRLKHRGLKLIEPGSPDWFNLKEVCKLATDFSNEFQISIKEGYKQYITIGLSMMKSFSIFKFKNLHSPICNIYEAQQEIQRDKYPDRTEQSHDIYLNIISEKTGYSQGYKNNPEKYKYFIYVHESARKFGVSIKTYIESQFAAFDWRNGIPDPMQLTGPKAIERLQKYAFENNIRLGETKAGIDYKKIKAK